MLEHETNSEEWIEKLFEDRHGQNWGSAARGKDHFVAFLWITKNCSTFFRKVTNDVRVDCANFNNVVVILRDPLERYISGLIHYRAVADVSTQQWLEKAKLGVVHFDVHTVPQTAFLKYLPEEKRHYFLHSPTVTDDIKERFGCKWIKKMHNEKKEVHRKYEFEKELLLYFRNNEDYFNLVQKQLEPDYILMDRVLPQWRENAYDIWDDKNLKDWRKNE